MLSVADFLWKDQEKNQGGVADEQGEGCEENGENGNIGLLISGGGKEAE